MRVDVSNISEFLENSLGDLLVGVSALLFLIGILLMSDFDQVDSGVALFFGVVLLVSGITIHLTGPPTLTKPSIGGFGTILICASLVTIASVGIVILYATPAGLRFREIVFKGMHMGTVATIETAHPLAWLATPLATIGLGLLIFGALLKFYDAL